jgi:hypothetical protein
MKRILSFIVIAALLGSSVAANAQSLRGASAAESLTYWQTYTGKLPIGSTVRVRTTNGKRTTGVLAIVDNTGITIAPKTRLPESPRHISFDQLEQVEIKESGMGAGKAAAIGVAAGAATFLIIIAVLTAAWD